MLDQNERSVDSEVLMPPPKVIPSNMHVHEIKQEPKVQQTNNSSKLDVKSEVATNITDKDNVFSSLLKTKVHCSVPKSDIICPINNTSSIVDEAKRLAFKNKLTRKIYGLPVNVVNTRIAPNLPIDSAKKTSVDNTKPKGSAEPLRFDENHFKNKNLVIDSVDILNMGMPMRSSSPTPSIDGFTVLAGNKEEFPDSSTDESKSTDPDVREILAPYLKAALQKKPKKFMKKEEDCSKNDRSKSEKAVAEWVAENDNIFAPPPATPTVLLYPATHSEGLLDVTSVSQNKPPKPPTNNIGRGIGKNTTLSTQMLPNRMFV